MNPIMEATTASGEGHLRVEWWPVETIRRPISYHTKPGELIYEPFSGSGTALIAAEEMGRTCYALEQAPQFVDVAVARWEAFTGKAALKERHGKA